MTSGYIKKTDVVREINRNQALNHLFFSRLIENLQEDDYWKDAVENPPNNDGLFIASILYEDDDTYEVYTNPVFYDAKDKEWSDLNCAVVNILCWANMPEPKTPDDWEEW